MTAYRRRGARHLVAPSEVSPRLSRADAARLRALHAEVMAWVARRSHDERAMAWSVCMPLEATTTARSMVRMGGAVPCVVLVVEARQAAAETPDDEPLVRLRMACAVAQDGPHGMWVQRWQHNFRGDVSASVFARQCSLGLRAALTYLRDRGQRLAEIFRRV